MRMLKRYRIPGTCEKKEEFKRTTVVRRRNGIIYPIKFTGRADSGRTDVGLASGDLKLLNTA